MSRANGEGTVYKRGERWEGQAFVDGKRVTRSGKTRAVVLKRLKEARPKEHGTPRTVAELAALWAEELLRQEGLTPASITWYEELSKHYVVPAVGKIRLTDLTLAHVEKMTSDILRRGLSQRTAAAARTCLGKMLRAAERRQWVPRNVAYLATPPKGAGKARTIKALRPTEVKTLLAALEGTEWHPVVLLGVSTGLRPGELLALHWDDVRDMHVTVRHAVVTGSDGTELKAPKRQRSYRTVPVPASVWGVLEGLRLRERGPLLFPATEGGLRRVDVYRRALNRAAGVSPHQLRHTFATHLLEAGTPIHHVAELLGDTVAVVEQAYSHVLRPKTETAALLEGLVGPL